MKTIMSGARSKFPALLEMVNRSKSYVHTFVDSHCHIDLLYSRFNLEKTHSFSKFVSDHADSFPANFEGCIAIFCDPKTFDDKDPDTVTLSMASQTDNVWLALGCHPKNATRFSESHQRGLRRALQHPRVVALGEIGLDYSGTFCDLADLQKSVLRCQISLALEMNLPLVIHCRDADDDCLDILKEMVPRDWRIHRHCFTQDSHTALQWCREFSNMFIGFTPLICKNNASVATVRQAAADVPLNRLLLETDAPYFIPPSVRKGVKLSHPGYAVYTAEALAEVRGITVDEVLAACRENTRAMYSV